MAAVAWLLRSLQEFLAEELPIVRPRVSGLIPGGSGLLILAGRPKRRKTFFAIDLFACFLLGRAFLGRPVERTPAAYFFLEGQEKAIQERLQRLVGKNPSVGHFVAVHPHELRLDLPEGRARFAEEIRKVNVRVVFIDPLAYVHELDENDNSAMAPFLRALGQLAAELDILLILVHHQTKSGRDDDSRSIRGAGALAGATEGNLLLVERRGQYRLVVELRDDEGDDLDLTFDPEQLRFVAAEPRAREKRPLAKDRVLAAMAQASDACTVGSLALSLQLSETAVANALRDLVADGRARVDGSAGRSIRYRAAS